MMARLTLVHFNLHLEVNRSPTLNLSNTFVDSTSSGPPHSMDTLLGSYTTSVTPYCY